MRTTYNGQVFIHRPVYVSIRRTMPPKRQSIAQALASSQIVHREDDDLSDSDPEEEMRVLQAISKKSKPKTVPKPRAKKADPMVTAIVADLEKKNRELEEVRAQLAAARTPASAPTATAPPAASHGPSADVPYAPANRADSAIEATLLQRRAEEDRLIAKLRSSGFYKY